MGFAPLNVSFEAMRDCIVQNRDFTACLRVQLPGIRSVLQDIYVLSEIQARLEVGGDVAILERVESEHACYLAPGETMRFRWKLRSGNTVASFPAQGTITANLHIPAYPWEQGSKAENYVISGEAPVRINVTDREWVNKFGRYDTAEERLGLPPTTEVEDRVLQLQHKVAAQR